MTGRTCVRHDVELVIRNLGSNRFPSMRKTYTEKSAAAFKLKNTVASILEQILQTWLSLYSIRCIRLAWYCGKMHSRHLFSYGKLVNFRSETFSFGHLQRNLSKVALETMLNDRCEKQITLPRRVSNFNYHILASLQEIKFANSSLHVLTDKRCLIMGNVPVAFFPYGGLLLEPCFIFLFTFRHSEVLTWCAVQNMITMSTGSW